VLIIVIFKMHISQNSVLTQLKCSKMFINCFIANFAKEWDNERIIKANQHLAKIWTKDGGLLFFRPPCT